MSSGHWVGKQKGSDEYRALDRKQTAARRERERVEQDKASREIGFKTDLFKKDIKRILVEERKLRPQVAEQCIPLVQVAARVHHIPANWYLVRHGLKNTLAGAELPEIASGIVIEGEVLYRHELECLFDFSLWRKPEISFEKFLEIRRSCKSDVMFLGTTLGRDFAEQPHGVWANEFFPKFNPDNLRPNYTQQESRAWLTAQADHYRTFLLLSSRNSFKSSFSQVLVMCAVLCFPDIRVLLVSETHELSKSFVGWLRQQFEILDESTPSDLLQYFPEYAVVAGEGSGMTYECPVRHLRLPAPTIRSTSADASVTGGRYDLLVCDDILSDQSCGNKTQTKATVNRYDSLSKLGEVGSSLQFILGTPWSETPPDLYKVLLDRAEADSETTIAVRIDPIMRIKPYAKNKKLSALVEEDIESVLFPTRLDWKFIRSEIMKNPKDETFFRSQNMVEFVPPEEAKWKVNFEEEQLRNAVVFQHSLLGWKTLRTILSIDTAASQSRYADMSCLAISKLYEDPKDSERYFAVLKVDADRYRPADLAARIADAYREHQPDVITIERPALWQVLQSQIEQECQKRGFSVAYKIHWREPGNSTAKSKAARIKNLEPLVQHGKLLFAHGDWVELAIQQFLHFDGVKKSGSADTSKDDIPDAIAMGVERVAGELLRKPALQKSKEELERESAAQAQNLMWGMYQMHFGNGANVIPHSVKQAAEPERDRGPIHRTLGRFGMARN